MKEPVYKDLTTPELLELAESTRRALEARRVSCPEDLRPHLDPYRMELVESTFVATLSGSHKLITLHRVSMGTVNRTIVHPRDIYRAAILDNAAAIIFAHNHPSGSPEPSPEDIEIANRLRAAGETLGIPMLDAVIFGPGIDYSLLEQGQLS